MNLRHLPLILGLFCLAVAPLAGAELVSVNATGTAAGNSGSFSASLSADGRFVAFQSSSTDLVPGGTTGVQVFVRDLLAGTTTLVSVNDPPYIGDAELPRINADGRYVAYQRSTCTFFICPASDIFVRDLQMSTTTLVSVDRNGMGGNAVGAVISADGRHVAFVGIGNNFVPNDTNGANDIFVRDLDAGITRLASVNAAGTASGNGESNHPALSADGRFVAFESDASDLVAGDGNGGTDVFWRDLLGGTTRLVSVNLAGNGSGTADLGKTTSGDLGISADGSRVSFVSNANDLVATDTNRGFDTFLRSLPDGPTRLVSINAAGTDSGNGGSGRAYLTPNGRFVAFQSGASDLLATGDFNGNQDVFLRDVDAGVTRLVSADTAGNAAGGLSELFLPIDNPEGFQVASGDGRFVAFGSNATNLVSGVSNPCVFDPCEQGYLRDLQAGTTQILSVTPAGDAAGNFGVQPGQISNDGRVAVFQSTSSNLSRQPDGNTTNDIFAVGVPQPVAIAAVPTLGEAGLALLVLAMAALGLRSLRH
jgi:Tol biopolymer transport system component